MKAIFLDKDGTLVCDAPFDLEPRRTYLCSGAGSALRLLARMDYRFFVLSNEDGIAYGHFREESMRLVADRLADLLFHEQLNLDGFYYCPHHPKGSVKAYAIECDCRKPKPGMLLRAAAEHHIDLQSSWMIGDLLHDVEAGNRAGCRSLLIDSGNETEWQLGPCRIPAGVAPDLYAAAVMIVSASAARQ